MNLAIYILGETENGDDEPSWWQFAGGGGGGNGNWKRGPRSLKRGRMMIRPAQDVFGFMASIHSAVYFGIGVPHFSYIGTG